MRAYSMDLRERALLDSDAGMKAADVAAKYRVSGSWVGVVARILTGPHDANRQDSHLPMRYDTGRPRAVIRLRISQPRTALLHESSLARTMPTDRILTYRCDTTLVGRGRSSD